MKKIALLIFLSSLVIKAMAQTEPANYAAVVSKFTTFYNNSQPDSIYKMYGPEMMSAMTADQCRDMVTQFKSQLGILRQTTFVSYTPTLPVAAYTANFQNAPITLSISLNKNNKIIGLYLRPVNANVSPAAPVAPITMDPSLVESPIVLKTLSGAIHGTVTMPKNATGKIPVVLIIAGSGPTDRNGNSPKLDLQTNAYKDIAEALGKNGIASVRYDKRMVGESETHNKEADLRFDDYVDDAVGLVEMLSQDDRFSKVIVLGHSEGALVGMLACRDQPVKAYISVAGAGDSADKILTEQMKSKPQFIQDDFKALLDSMRKGKTIDKIDPALYFIARPSVQRYLMSWCKYNPPRVLKTLKIPVMIVQGTTDLRVTVDNADKLKKYKSEATMLIIPNMNHVLKDAPADRDQNLATYNKPDMPLKSELMPGIINFIKGVN